MTTVQRLTHLDPSTADRVDPDRVDDVVAVFGAMIDEGLHAGAQLSIRLGGNPVLDIVGGEGEDGAPLTERSLFPLLSTTKNFAALATLMLHDRGLLDLDQPIAAHWPEFGSNGKDTITVRMVLSHRAGLSGVQADGGFYYGRWKEWTEPGGVAAMIESLTPEWAPGSRVGYHGTTFGLILDELIRRTTGVDTGTFIAEEVGGPLDAPDVRIGIDRETFARVTPLADRGGGAERDAARGGQRFELPSDARSFMPDFFNSFEVLRHSWPFGSGVGCAHDIARLMDVFAHGGTVGGRTFLSDATFVQATTPTNDPSAGGSERDQVIAPVVWGLGLMLGRTGIYGRDATDRACGHFGGATSIAWADPAHRLAVAFLPTAAQPAVVTGQRFRRLGDAIYALVRS